MAETGSGLIISTFSADLGLGLVGLGHTPRWQAWPLGREMAQLLHPCLAEFLPPQAWSGLEFIAVAQGPGSFTGTRLGVVTARTLAQQLHLPLFGISSLAAGAWVIGQEQPHPHVIAIDFPAQRDHVYGAIFEVTPNAATIATINVIEPEQLVPLQAWETLLEKYQNTAQRYPMPDIIPIVQGIAALAQAQWQSGARPSWESVIPFYGSTWQ